VSVSLTGRRHLTYRLDLNNADPKGNWHRPARKKADQRTVRRTEG
jgi:hypothetical protein